MRISSVRLGTLSGRVTVKTSISCVYTGTRYGCYGAGRERDVSQDARWRRACTELVHEARASYSLESFYCEASFTNFFYETRRRGSMTKHRRREKKEEALRRVLLLRWTVAESSQSTCPDVCRRGHHWLCHP